MAELSASRRMMQGLAWQRWSAQLRYRLQRLPWQATVGAGLLLVAGLVAVALVMPQYQALHALQDQVAQLRREAPPLQLQAAPVTPRTALDSFYASLPPEAAASQSLGRLLEIAAQHGIAPDKMEYQLARNNAAPFSVYQVTLPVHAQYVALRSFVNGVLNAMPYAALKEVSMVRDENVDGMVNARLRFAFYLGHPH